MSRCALHSSLITSLCLYFADALRIDDFNHTIKYSGAWTDEKNILDDVSSNWDSTLHYSNISGAKATINFTGELDNLLMPPTGFHAHRLLGTSIAVYGSFHPPGRYNMVSQYSIDGQLPYTFTPNPTVLVAIHRSLFYSSPQLPYGEHTLVVTNLGEQLFLDFFEVQDEMRSISSSAPSAASNTVTPTGTTTSVQPATTNVLGTSETQNMSDYPRYPGTMNTSDSSHFATPTTLRSSSATQPTTNAAKIPATSNIENGTIPTLTPLPRPQSATLATRAIAGMIVGGALIVMFSGLGVWFCRRRRMNGSDSESDHLHTSSPKGQYDLFTNRILPLETNCLSA